jgi:translation initiation factor 2 alpha subunit (eIF-2alpha)
LKAPDFKSAESAWENATNAAIELMQSSGGEARAWRE